jgi:mevalonate kinase
MITASAPGKIILFGEHAVVYDKLGIASTINKRCYIEVLPLKEDTIFIKSKDLKLSKSLKKEELFDLFKIINKLKDGHRFDEIKDIAEKDRLTPSFFVIANILNKYGFKGLSININSEIFNNLGSSSAVFSAIALATLKIFGKNPSKEEVSGLAFQGDLMAHGGTPSGIDNSVVTYGGYIKYKKSEGVNPLNIDFKIPLLIVDSGELAITGEMVSFVRKKKEQNPRLADSVFSSLDNISNNALESLRSRDFENLGRLMTDYYNELKKLDISTPGLDKIIKIALENGALGVKPTGAWGGGCCLVLAKDQKRIVDLKDIFEKKGFKFFQTNIGIEGVKLI